MKKKILIIVSIIVVLTLAVGGAYLIDKNRMDNNKPVIFSTWGYDYAVPVEDGKELPYFADKISYISSVQSGVEINENYNESISGSIDGQNTSAYIPAGMEFVSKDDVGTKIEEIDFNREREKVTIEVLMDTVTRKGATIVITDKNENPYGCGKSYKVEQKVNNEWKDLKPRTEMIFEEIAYSLDEKGQYRQNIDWTRFYGELEKGIYRIVKDTYDKGYIYFYSNEFEIK